MAKLTNLEDTNTSILVNSHSITSGKLTTTQFRVLPYITACLSSTLHLTPQPNFSYRIEPIHCSKFKAHGSLPRNHPLLQHSLRLPTARQALRAGPRRLRAQLSDKRRAGANGRARCRCTERTPPRKGIPVSPTAGPGCCESRAKHAGKLKVTGSSSAGQVSKVSVPGAPSPAQPSPAPGRAPQPPGPSAPRPRPGRLPGQGPL